MRTIVKTLLPLESFRIRDNVSLTFRFADRSTENTTDSMLFNVNNKNKMLCKNP